MDEKIAQLSGIWIYEVLERKKFSDDKANALIPILITFVFFARYLVSGLTMGGVK
jgi:ABC-type maltose transport system permease subunit